MLNERQINMLPGRISERIGQINNEYLESVGNVIKKIGELRPSDIHKFQQMYDYGADLQRITLKLAEVSEKNTQEIYEIFDIVAKDNYEYAKLFYEAKNIEFIPYEENERLKRYVKSLAKQTVDEYVDLTQHTAFAIFDTDGKSIAPLFARNRDKFATSLSDTYTEVVDYAVSKVQLGQESYQKAVKDICKAMVNSGIKTVDYATGYSRRLESAVRQNVLWGIKQCNQNIADRIGEEFGADGYEISYHSNPRPEHADMAGKQFAIGPARVVKGVYYPSFEEVAKPLLDDFGCLHFKFPILLGISRSAYGEEELKEFKENDAKPFEFEGKNYTKYDGRQLQSKLESQIIRHKELANMAKSAGDKDLRREAQGKINLLASKYHKLSQASGLSTRAERMRNIKNPLTKELDDDIIGMNRRIKNIGVFAELQEYMSKKHIRNVADECGIDLKGLTLNIDKNEELLRIFLTGRADYEKVGQITFFPNAFKSKEELVRTIYHEKIHVEQYKKYGIKFVQNNSSRFEKEAYKKEEEFIENLKERCVL